MDESLAPGRRLAAAWQRPRASLWFVPGLIVSGATVLAVVLIGLALQFASRPSDRWPGFFGAGAEGARAMLTAIASSIITVAGVVLAFVGIAYLIYFIHHVGVSIQASAILHRIADETEQSFRTACAGEARGRTGRTGTVADGDTARPDLRAVLEAPETGYLVRIDADRLLQLACRHDVSLRVVPQSGSFVVRGDPLLAVENDTRDAPELLQKALRSVDIDRERTAESDPAYGLRQLVDVALKALSPGINDPTTARAGRERNLAAYGAVAASRLRFAAH
jgi:uncharacterized membrane protein